MIRDLSSARSPGQRHALRASVALVAAVAAALLALAGHPEMGMGSAILLAGVPPSRPDGSAGSSRPPPTSVRASHTAAAADRRCASMTR